MRGEKSNRKIEPKNCTANQRLTPVNGTNLMKILEDALKDFSHILKIVIFHFFCSYVLHGRTCRYVCVFLWNIIKNTMPASSR